MFHFIFNASLEWYLLIYVQIFKIFLMLSLIGTGVKLSPSDMNKAQKYCKWAVSALDYEDSKTAIDNLQKALNLLKTGKDS